MNFDLRGKPMPEGSLPEAVRKQQASDPEPVTLSGRYGCLSRLASEVIVGLTLIAKIR
jgi:hypothetical protein